jgi:hypothetical protein
MKLQPLFGNTKQVLSHKGKFEVQLEIPEGSTLTSKDIDKVLNISSWTEGSTKDIADYEGGRSVLVDRESPVKIGPVELKALEISGVGYKNIDFRSTLQDGDGGKFHPPSNENLMNRVAGKMSTSHAEGSKIVTTKPSYRAMGTYTLPELKQKVANTMEVSKIKLDSLATPIVEAYGRYIDQSLRNQDGQFGFFVFDVPGVSKKTAAEESFEKFKSTLNDKEEDPRIAIMNFYYSTAPYIISFADGLRELHDKGRRAHLQTHLANVYLTEGVPYLKDWATARKFDKNKKENVLNRTIDLNRPVTDYGTIFKSVFPSAPNDFMTKMLKDIYGLAMEGYSQHPLDEIDYSQLELRAARAMGHAPDGFDVVAQWMSDAEVEGFMLENMTQTQTKAAKVGRNNPCPCGSGTKYKKCCGR